MARKKSRSAYPCANCGSFAFPVPFTLCFWCRPERLVPKVGKINKPHRKGGKVKRNKWLDVNAD